MRKDIALFAIVLACFTVVVTWGVYEKHVENSHYSQSYDDKLSNMEKFLRQDMGEYSGKLTVYLTEMQDIRNSITKAVSQGTSANKRVDDMQAYFQKYSTEAIEEKLREMRLELDSVTSRVENPDWERFDEKYATKWKVNQMSHLPSEWEWRQLRARWDDAHDAIEKLLARLEENIKHEAVPQPPDPPKDLPE